MSEILCPECYEREGYPEEKCCSHGVFATTCTSCGATRVATGASDDGAWHCLGGKSDKETR